VRGRWGDGEKGRRRDGEKERRGDGEKMRKREGAKGENLPMLLYCDQLKNAN